MRLTNEYISSLKGKIFKILPLFEENNVGLPQYIDSLIYELYGLQYLIEKEKHHTLISLISILEHFYDDSIQPTVEIETIRREVFHCLDLIEKSFRVGD